MMKLFKSNFHLRFVLFNLAVVGIFIIALWSFIGGDGYSTPFNQIGISLLISIPIIFFQYPLLNLRRNWFYKSLVFYLSMVAYLFLLGVILGWNQTAGGFASGSWLSRFWSGFLLIVMGQLLGGLIVFLPILGLNFMFREYFFDKKNS